MYGRKVKEEEKEAAGTLSRSMSYAEGRFGKSGKDSDDSFGDGEDIMSKANLGRRGNAITSSKVGVDDSDEDEDDN
jgi:hypothetical protein